MDNICNVVPPATAADDNPNEDDWQELNQKHGGGPDGFCFSILLWNVGII